MDKVGVNRSTVTDALINEKPKTKSNQPKSSDDVPVDVPDYVVSISAEKLEEKSTYSPEEVKTKARAFMAMGTMSPEQQTVLEEILEKQADEK